jgi:hypothetical protein
MIPYETYKVLHILGVLLAFATLGGLALTVANGATKSTHQSAGSSGFRTAWRPSSSSSAGSVHWHVSA